MTKNAAITPKRRDYLDPDRVAAPVHVLSDHHARIRTPWHHHRRLQLLHVSEGALTVETRSARFVVPPQRAVWIPSGVDHRILATSPFWLTTCYIDESLTGFSRPQPSVVSVDRLADALLIAVSAFSAGGPQTPAEERLCAVLLDCLGALQTLDIVLPLPLSDRLRRITDLLQADLTRNDTLAVLAAKAALTERTAARLFKTETGMSFGAWRSHLRMQTALEHLSAGQSVTGTAFSVGYQDVSSFIEAFRQIFGRTPSQVLKV